MFRISIFLMFIAVGLIPMGTQLVEGGSWGPAPSIGFLVVLAGSVGLLERASRRRVGHTETIPSSPAAPGSESVHVADE